MQTIGTASCTGSVVIYEIKKPLCPYCNKPMLLFSASDGWGRINNGFTCECIDIEIIKQRYEASNE